MVPVASVIIVSGSTVPSALSIVVAISPNSCCIALIFSSIENWTSGSGVEGPDARKEGVDGVSDGVNGVDDASR